MATPVTYNGVSYSIPAFGDVGYAQGPGNLSSYLIALSSGPQATGGLFSLTAPLNFGPNFGLIAVNYTTTTTNPATAGQIRLAKTDTIDWRNNANSANLPLGINVSDQLTFNGVVLSTAAAGGTVNTGVAGRLTLYPAAGNTVDDVYTQNAFGIDVLIATQAARSVALEYTIPNPGNAVAAATFALLELAQTFTALQTFAQTVTISATTNQLVLGTTNTVTITSPAPAASRVYTIPDVLGAASFVMTAGAQSIAGVKTFTGGAGAITLSGSTIAMGGGAISASGNITFSPTTAGIVGTTTNDNVAAGNVGEVISASVVRSAGVALTSGTTVNIGSISLTAGDWDVRIANGFRTGGATSITSLTSAISTTTGTLPSGDTIQVPSSTGQYTVVLQIPIIPGSGNDVNLSGVPSRISLAATTTYFLVVAASFTVSTLSAYGSIVARRVR